MEKIATDTSNFEVIRTAGYTYVDKTGALYPLVEDSIGRHFFLARPRRFGKSLLVSTLQKLFEGRRDLFAGLAIDALPWDWSAKYPVLRLDMSLCTGETVDKVKNRVLATLHSEAERLGVPLRDEGSPAVCFRSLIDDVAATSPSGQLVLLVDEYDKPLTRWIGTDEALPYQDFLSSFYTVIKATAPKQRFCLVTGVCRFPMASMSSGLNNLTDITMDARFATLLGYTRNEARASFPQRLDNLARQLGTDADDTVDRLEDMYGGYCFNRSMVQVFNPVSLGRCLDTADLRSYWFETGTPSWLMSLVKTRPLGMDVWAAGSVGSAGAVEVSENQLGTFEPNAPYMPAALFQAGYLTIKGCEERGRRHVYLLGFPNHEVEDAFNAWPTDAYTGGAGTAMTAGTTRG